MKTYGLNNFSKTMGATNALKLNVSIEAACSNRASAWGSVGINSVPWPWYFLLRYLEIARDSYRMKPSSSFLMTSVSERVHSKKSEETHDVRDLSEWLLRHKFGSLLFAFGKVDRDQFVRDLLLLADKSDEARAGGKGETVQLDHGYSGMRGYGV
jgi:hypothetical protein